MIVIEYQLVPALDSTLREVFGKFNFHKESGLLQFWAFSTDPEAEMGWNLVLTNITCNPTQDQGLEDYRKRCFEREYPSVGIETSVGNWLAGRAAQTGIADHRTKHHVLDQEDQHSRDIGARGQLVLPVFSDEDAGNKLAGVIEYVTIERKESYVEDFEQFQNSLKDKGLKSTYMGKTIKVVYNGHMIKFTLPLSAKFTDMLREVTKRFTGLEHKKFRVEYVDKKDTNTSLSRTSASLTLSNITKANNMEAMNSQDHFNIMVVILCQLVPKIESVLSELFGKFNFREESGLLQFWAYRRDPDSEEIGCNLVLTHLTYNPTQDQGLEDYRNICLENQYPFIGIETNVGSWLPGRAAQTGFADHRTRHHVLDIEDQHSRDIGAWGS
ncbi:hypothetical protein E3N88_30853 [Mikania micrantha]|uniref:PB1 domain-containing protein n=1 Tax=Mikania micrantha TaxID=192012 RepID=A0A5N6MNR2_9ASTR|nr:hypothetical protein E3N88_30853 [Mikania micrantha]